MVKDGFSNGAIIGDDNISIDHWENPNNTIKTTIRPRIYFLTHLHADHIHGLNRYWNKKIFTSALNCKLAPCFIKGIDEKLLIPLELNKEITLSISPKWKILVTLIDANHIPGSVMILIKGYFGNILYTGDFRFNLDMLNVPTLKNIINR